MTAFWTRFIDCSIHKNSDSKSLYHTTRPQYKTIEFKTARRQVGKVLAYHAYFYTAALTKSTLLRLEVTICKIS